MGQTYTGDEARRAQDETNDARSNLLVELETLYPIACINSTRVLLAIEALIDAKIKWRS